MKEATLYKKLKENKVKCTACKHYCIISENNTGICGVRENKNEKLYLLVYGKAASMNIDPIEKKPLFHFLPSSKVFSFGTFGCNFSCSFCQNWDISQVTKDMKSEFLKNKTPEQMEIRLSEMGYELSPEKIVEIAKEENIPTIAYTYNEPSIFIEYVKDTAQLANKASIKNVLVSSGYETIENLEYIKKYIDGINIDLKSFSKDFYNKFCRAEFHKVLETIKEVHNAGIWVEITTLIIPGENDSEKELNDLSRFIASIDKNIPWHVTAFHPDYKMQDKRHTSHETLLKAYKIGKDNGLNYVYIGNIRDDEHESTYCPKCNTLLIRRSAYEVKIENMKDWKCSNCDEMIPGVWE